MSVFRPVFLDQRVPLAPTELREAASDVDGFLLKKLRADLEERCCAHGWVRGGSTQILARSMGQAEHCRFTGDFMYNVKVRVLCFLPETGQAVDAQILKTNKLGAYALLVDQGRVSEAIRILLPRDLHIGNTEFDDLMVGGMVRVRLLRSRFQKNDAFIQAVGTYEGASSAEVKLGRGQRRLQPDVPATEGAAEEETKEGGEGERTIVSDS
jgi:DNA-directed RNA polymerase subunit E'/Rpb7